MVGQAKQLAALARNTHPADAGQRVDLVWRRALGRKPNVAEREKTLASLNDEASLDRLCLVLLNTNEFLYVD